MRRLRRLRRQRWERFGVELRFRIGIHIGVELRLRLGIELRLDLGLRIRIDLGLELRVRLRIGFGFQLGIDLKRVWFGIDLRVRLHERIELRIRSLRDGRGPRAPVVAQRSGVPEPDDDPAARVGDVRR
jgi:hypothetical protein